MFIAKELLRLVNDEDGLTVVEYAIAGGLVTAGVVTLFTALGDNVEILMGDLCTNVAEGIEDGTAGKAACD